MTRRKPMQVSIEKVLKAHGQLERFRNAFATGDSFYLKLKQECYMPLVIEKVDKDRVAIAHYFIVNGDVQYTPRSYSRTSLATPTFTGTRSRSRRFRYTSLAGSAAATVASSSSAMVARWWIRALTAASGR